MTRISIDTVMDVTTILIEGDATSMISKPKFGIIIIIFYIIIHGVNPTSQRDLKDISELVVSSEKV